MTQFDDIRPFRDDEVASAIQRLLADKEFIETITAFRFSSWPKALQVLLRPIVAAYLSRQAKKIHSVDDLQLIAKTYLNKMLDDTTSSLTMSGMQHLQKDKAYLFVSNHRDIVVDPAIVNWTLHQAGHTTPNIAIGDNLLTKPFISDLMRLNKSFIVNRSATAPREKLKAAKHLSAYIHHSISEENHSIWIAHREGRAKDGLDKTNSAVIKMLMMSKPKKVALSDYIKELNIVPVSISYELDPCDELKARELYQLETQGSYQKAEHEDAQSIARGITGKKGRVHITYGQALTQEFDDVEQLVEAIDKAIIKNYVLQPSNCIAYQELHGQLPKDVLVTDLQTPYQEKSFVPEKQIFHKRLRECDSTYREFFLKQYANPVISQQAVLNAE